MIDELSNQLNHKISNDKFINKLSVWTRLLIVSSSVWIIVSLIRTEPWTTYRSRGGSTNDLADFLLTGIIPIIIVWGIFWIWSGYKNYSSDKSGLSRHDKSIVSSLAVLSVLKQSQHKGSIAKDCLMNEHKLSKYDIDLYKYYNEMKNQLSEKVNKAILKRG